MTLKRSYLLGLIMSTAFAYGCEATPEDPGLGDSGAPVGVGGSVSGTGGTTGGSVGGTTAGTVPTGTTAGTVTNATVGGTTSGTIPGGTTSGSVPVGTLGGTGSTPGGSTAGGDAGVPGGMSDGGMGGGEGGTPVVTGGSCPGLPAVTNFDMKGPFDVQVKMDVVAGGEGCSLFRPGTSLGKDGFKHPIVVWGNGIITTPDMYTETLSLFASHGFVVIACNSSNPERACLNACMEWLVKQNASGDMAGKLDVTKELTAGYSWGGGASIDTANRPNVKATVSFHGMPPRESDPWGKMKSPLLLFTSTGDDFVSASGYVTPNYQASKVPTFYATLQESVDHLYILDAPLGGSAAKERGPAIAWMRYWACGDEGAKKYFFGADATLCKAPFKCQSKPMDAWK